MGPIAGIVVIETAYDGAKDFIIRKGITAGNAARGLRETVETLYDGIAAVVAEQLYIEITALGEFIAVPAGE